MKKFCNVLSLIYGYGMLVTFIAGGLTFFGYVVALCIGGEVATQICTVLYKHVLKAIIIAASCVVVLGLLKMYLSGEIQADVRKKRAEAKEKRAAKKAKRAEKKANATKQSQDAATATASEEQALLAQEDASAEAQKQGGADGTACEQAPDRTPEPSVPSSEQKD